MKAPLTRQASAWVYQGVWAVLTELFHVPRQPPSLPGSQVLAMRPCDGWLLYRKVGFWIGLLATMIPISAVGLVILISRPVLAVAVLVPVFVVVLGMGLASYVSIHLGYDTTWYVLSDRSLRIRRGVWTIHETTITFENVQNVKITQGPLQRLLGFSDLVIETAGGGGSGPRQQLEHSSHVGLIEGVEAPNELREQIMTRVRASRSAGLGDEHDTESHPTSASTSWTPAHLEALREIAAHVARLRARSG
ncbi:PH domain-containing protein [Cystobacter fuscus]|uniref:PH domain-containing protein n=1 Tax=Cystobacter fuscus TaxID=43 RepID=UPI002B2DDB5D|nr:PH domain-containing protein [Cystobacter fuscus]